MVWRKIVFFLFSFFPFVINAQVEFKQPCFEEKGEEYALLRILPLKDDVYIVNTNTLKTGTNHHVSLSDFHQCNQNSNYQNLRRKALSDSSRVYNRGLIQGQEEALSLTIDMCPSTKVSYDLELFESLIKHRRGTPVTISMTKKWALQHPEDFKQLKAWDKSQALKITWMNHGSMHPYKKGIALDKNFINQKDVNFEKEVLDNEDFLIKEGCVPSIFYRFAGLVSNDKAYDLLIKELGLVPIGSQAWLAKGEMIKKGSIVLVHGNKNESLGVKLFLERKSKVPLIELSELLIKEGQKE